MCGFAWNVGIFGRSSFWIFERLCPLFEREPRLIAPSVVPWTVVLSKKFGCSVSGCEARPLMYFDGECPSSTAVCIGHTGDRRCEVKSCHCASLPTVLRSAHQIFRSGTPLRCPSRDDSPCALSRRSGCFQHCLETWFFMIWHHHLGRHHVTHIRTEFSWRAPPHPPDLVVFYVNSAQVNSFCLVVGSLDASMTTHRN